MNDERMLKLQRSKRIVHCQTYLCMLQQSCHDTRYTLLNMYQGIFLSSRPLNKHLHTRHLAHMPLNHRSHCS